MDVAIVGMCRGYACQKGFQLFFVLLSSFLDVFGFAANDAFAISMVLWLWMRPWLECADESMYARAGLLDVGAERDGFGGRRRL